MQDCALQDIGVLQRTHNFDPNLPDQEIRHLNEVIKTGSIEKTIEVDASFTNKSPYEAVRAAVRETDGEEIANTVRAWILGFVFVTLASGINMFLSMRSPAITIPTVVILLLVYPCGQFIAKVLPTKKFRIFSPHMVTEYWTILDQRTFGCCIDGECHIRLRIQHGCFTSVEGQISVQS